MTGSSQSEFYSGSMSTRQCKYKIDQQLGPINSSFSNSQWLTVKLSATGSEQQWAIRSINPQLSQGDKFSPAWFLVQMLDLTALGYYLKVLGNKNLKVCIKSCLQVLPVEGWWVSLGLTAEHYLSAILARLKGKYHTAGLFGEHGPLQDSTSWLENQQNCISFDVLLWLRKQFCLQVDFEGLQRKGSKWSTVLLKRWLNHSNIYAWHGSVGHASRTHEHFSY